jgi:hypothetical protein
MAQYNIKADGDLTVIVDEMGEFVDAFPCVREAVRVCREMNTPETVSAKRRVEGTYGCANTAVIEPTAAVVTNDTVVVAEVKIELVAATGVSKAEQIRACIAQVKAQGGQLAAVVTWAMENLGMAKPLATTYAKNNWNKA